MAIASSSPQTADSGTRQPYRTLVLLSILIGLCSGIAEVVIVIIRQVGFDTILPLNRQFVWMIPSVSVVLSMGLGLLLFCTLSFIPARIGKPLAFFSLTFLGFLGPLFAIPRMHDIAILILAAGLATQATRLLLGRSDRFWGFVPRLTALVAALVILVGTGVNVLLFLEIRSAVSALPQARPNAPNVLLIVMDTVRARSLSLYGYGRATSPGLERLARTSVVFDSAFATAPWTLPSHASMFTGRLPHELSVGWRAPLDGTYPTLAGVLKDQGYVTAGFVSNLIYGSAGHGLNRGFIYYEDYPVSVGQAIISSSIGSMVGSKARIRRLLHVPRVLNRKTATEVSDEFLDWIAGNDRKPFFAFLNYMDAHEPYLPPAPFKTQFGPGRDREVFEYSPVDAFRPAKWKMSPSDVQKEVDEYDGAVSYIDSEVSRVVDELTKRGLLENTLLIVTSDHGEHLGEHRLFGHGNSLYRTVLEVPLLLSFPGHVPSGTAVDTPVTLRDLPATVMDLAGLEDRSPFTGESLSRHWGKEKGGVAEDILISEASKRDFGAQQPWYPLTKGDMKSTIRGGYHYIWNQDGEEELFDVDQDREELMNLAGSEEGRRIIRGLRQ